jgi:hypothetical protein
MSSNLVRYNRRGRRQWDTNQPDANEAVPFSDSIWRSVRSEDRVQAAYDLCDLRDQHKWERIAAMVGIPADECKAIYLRLRNCKEYRGLRRRKKEQD